jgi:hypothetical protein
MRLSTLCAAALATLAPATLAAQDKASYVIRIGQDTIGLEEYTRTTSQVKGQYVLRSPVPVHALLTADLNADGTIRRLEVITHNISGGPGPAETRSTVEIAGDSAVITAPGRDSTVTRRVGGARNAALWLGYNVAMFEDFARRGRSAGTGGLPVLTTGQLRGTGVVTRGGGGGDTLLGTITLAIGQLGPMKIVLDRNDRLVYLNAVGTPLQIVVQRVPSVDIAAAGPAFASRPLGTLSPRDTLTASVSGAQVSVLYGRPSKRGREIFGQVVPWNAVWRTGANAATHFHTSADLTVGGAAVPAGTYTLWTLPSPSGWKLIINKQTGQWGTDYHAEQDLVRVDMRVETLAQPVEQMTIAIEPDGAGAGGAGGAVLRVEWDRTRASVPLTRKRG